MDDGFQCTSDGLFGAVAYNCQKYYQCYNTNTPFATKTLVSCPATLYFDTQRQYCTFANIVKCESSNTDSTTATPAQLSTTTVAIATDTSTIAIVTDPLTQATLPIVTSTQSVATTTTTASSGFRCVKDGLFAALELNCRKYYLCYNTLTNTPFTTLISCPPGLLFDDSLHYCNWADFVKCGSEVLPIENHRQPTTHKLVKTTHKLVKTTRVTPKWNAWQAGVTVRGEAAGFKCQKDGMFAALAHKCRKYYQCSNVNTSNIRQVLVDCPRGLLFDDKLKICNFPLLVKCGQ